MGTDPGWARTRSSEFSSAAGQFTLALILQSVPLSRLARNTSTSEGSRAVKKFWSPGPRTLAARYLSQSSTAIPQSVVDDKAEDQVEHRLHAVEREEQRDASDDDDGQGAEESVLHGRKHS